jgi:hypothetical protein
MEDALSADYVVARENFKEAAKHVSPEKDPVMFNLLFGLQSLTIQIEADFGAIEAIIRDLSPKKDARKNGRLAPKKAVRARPGSRQGGKARKS